MNVDPAALESYREVMGEEADVFIADIINTFIVNAPKLIEQMEQNLIINDNNTFMRNAHTLKSNSGTVGATALAKLASILEKEGGMGNLQNLADTLSEAKAELGQVITYFKKINTPL
jgi:HPt (histidine-containing phosphotransfer) domain-containing protein